MIMIIVFLEYLLINIIPEYWFSSSSASERLFIKVF